MDHRWKNIDKEFFKRSGILYRKSKDEVWKDLFMKLEEDETIIAAKTIFQSRTFLAVAASVALLFAVFSIFRYRTEKIICPPGEHASINLPDGSTVDLNASSELSYHPLWWRFSRELKFEGEAFFNVEPGGSFRVLSNSGVTEVVGTSFNIFSRYEKYSVTCLTGRVKVFSAHSKVEATLLPMEQATLNRNGDFEIKLVSEERTVPAWKNNFLKFTSAPIRDVLDEIERQYNVEIAISGYQEHIYTGNFSFNADVETILTLICRPLDLEYLKIADAEYIIKPISEN